MDKLKQYLIEFPELDEQTILNVIEKIQPLKERLNFRMVAYYQKRDEARMLKRKEYLKRWRANKLDNPIQ